MICIYYLFMFWGDGCRKVERQHITSSCSWCHKSLLQSCLFWNAGEYAHNECIESCLLSRSFSTRTICTVSCFDPPALCTSSISWLFLFCFVKSTFKTESNFVLMTVRVFVLFVLFFFVNWFVFVFITRPVNISNLRITHIVLSSGCQFLNRSHIILLFPWFPPSRRTWETQKLCAWRGVRSSVCYHSKCCFGFLVFFNSMLGSWRRWLAIVFTYLFLL